MNPMIERFADRVKGCVSGFDRIVFKGMFQRLVYLKGTVDFLRRNGILNKDYKKWMLEKSSLLTSTSEQYAKDNCGQGIIPLSSWRIRKEELAHERQQQEQIKKGLIGVWSCQEEGSSYRAHYCAKTGYPIIRHYRPRCKHLYFYYDHEKYGFMNIRLQTWFPYHIQICLNGREWLRRSLENEGIDYSAKGNKFFHIGDYQKAQSLLDDQLDTRWAEMLDGFVPAAFPLIKEFLGTDFSYYWTMWQSEWATDLLFDSSESLQPLMNSILRHAHLNGTSIRVLRYLDRPIRINRKPYKNLKDDVVTRLMNFNDGQRIRHWVDKNSVKAYNEQNVFRVETTINNPAKFKVYRHKQGQSQSEKKSRLPLRKGVADIALRAKVSQEVNDRFLENVSTFKDDTPAGELFGKTTRPRFQNGRRIRALDPTGKDYELLRTISDPAFRISGLTNKMLRELLQETPWGAGRTDKQLSARISRHLRLLRDHGIIRKLPKQNRYQVTIKGVKITNALNAFWAASTEELMKMAA